MVSFSETNFASACARMAGGKFGKAKSSFRSTFNKLTSVFYASVLLLMINFVITLSKCCKSTRRRRVDLQQTLTML